MAHEGADESKLHMGLPLPNGKLAMWLFLVTEIMFFTAILGTYMLLHAPANQARTPWPAPTRGCTWSSGSNINTFVLIVSSFTVDAGCHWYLHVSRRLDDAG